MKLNNRYITLVAVVVFVAINYGMSLIGPVRVDMSKGQAHTLSASSKKILRSLDTPVTITFFASSTLPSKLQPVRREVADLLTEYKSAGGSHVSIVTVDPKKSGDPQKALQGYAIPELNFSQQESDRYAVTTGYFGIGVAQGAKRQSIGQVADIASLEYNLTSTIYKLSVKSLPRVGIIGGDSIQGLRGLHQLASGQFDVQDVASPTADLKSIVVVDSRSKKYSDDEANQIERYIRQGGHALFFVDGIWVGDSMSTGDADHNLYGLLQKMGVVLNKDLLLSSSAEVVNFGGGTDGYNVLTTYPYWVRTSQFDTNSSYFSNVRQVTYPWVGSLTLRPVGGVTLKSIIRTTPVTWSLKENFALNPSAIKDPKQSELRQFIVGVEGRVNSSGAFVVIPSSRFVEDQYVPRTSDNLDLVLNILSDYSSGGALSGIRQRSVDLYPIPDMTSSARDVFKYTNILLLPALLALYGAYRLYRRK